MCHHTLPSSRPVIAFLTDFGLYDGYVGVMKGVVLDILLDVQLVDVSHDISPQNVASGAWVLASSYRYFPAGTVYTCVIDPGVGSVRRPVALHAGDWFFVGPDNGLFHYVLEEQQIHDAVVLSNPAYHRTQVSNTFHGRDVFSPVAAHIARGVVLSELGEPLDPSSLQRLDISRPRRLQEAIEAQVVHVDHFGNLITNIPLAMVPEYPVQLVFNEQGVVVTEQRRFFSSAPMKKIDMPFIYGDSSGYVAIAVQNGNASALLNVTTGAPVTLVITSS